MHIRPYIASTILCLSFSAVAVSPLPAQRIDPIGQTRTIPPPDEVPRTMGVGAREPDALRGVAGGILGGGIGLGLGLLGGANLSAGPDCPGEDCGIVGAIVGATVGESIGLALGSHYAARGRGNVIATTLATTAIGVAGVAAAFAAEGVAPFIIGVTPIIQGAVILAMER